MFQVVKKIAIIMIVPSIVYGCSPKLSAEPAAIYFVQNNDKNYAPVMDAILSFADKNGYTYSGDLEELKHISEYYYYEFYKVDSQIVVMKSKTREGIDIFIYTHRTKLSHSDSKTGNIGQQMVTYLEGKGINTIRID